MYSKMNRRDFFRRVGVVSMIPLASSEASDSRDKSPKGGQRVASIIDLTLCDGCEGRGVPACVEACEIKNRPHFPEPSKPILDYWPQKRHEDWSDKRGLKTRLTPYNWTFVEKVSVEGRRVFIPRRCMHCDDAPCQKLCPFGVIGKSAEGAVSIDTEFCMGGAKCRAACPWEIPQRQAGVGLYLKLAPKVAGGGALYKCDMCSDLLKMGKAPACEEVCPKKAIVFGPREAMRVQALAWQKEHHGYIYGMDENGGTATFYLSSVPFEKIHEAIRADKEAKQDRGFGRPLMPVGLANPLASSENLAKSVLIAPVAGIIAAGIAVYKSHTKRDKT